MSNQQPSKSTAKSEFNDKNVRKAIIGPERPEHAGARLSFMGPSHVMKQQRRELPVSGVKTQLLPLLEKHPTLIVIGETGSGKSTQIPQFIYEHELHSDKMIAVTQPRRLAATSLSQRVAVEMDCEVGTTVGYSIRFDEKSSEATKIIFLTEGMLLREALSDTLLSKYSVIFLDEAHERNINTDILFGIVKKAQATRSKKEKTPLKIVIMSATMDVDHFQNYFDQAPVIYIEGRQHPINIYYTKKSQQGTLFSTLCTIRQINEDEDPGDILVFLSGSEEIEAMVLSIKSMAQLLGPGVRHLRPYPVYAALPPKQLENIFRPAGERERKVIVATNVAETSITIPGIKYVVDSGLVKAKSFDPNTGLELLKEEKISKAQAWQRSGRAGRQSSGTCYRVYTKQEFESLAEYPIPEILRCNLASAILMMAGMGIDAYTFDFMSKPRKELLDAAVDQLVLLKAFDSKENRKLTDLGKKMTDFPLDPDLAKILLSARSFECVEEVLSIVAVLCGESVFCRPAEHERNRAKEAHEKFLSSEGDHITLLTIYRQYSSAANKKNWCEANFLNYRNLKFASSVREQLSARCRSAGIPLSSCGQETEKVRKCLITGLFTKVAELQRDKEYRTVGHRQVVSIHPSSSLRNLYPPYVLYSEIVQTSKTYLRHVSVVDADWLREIAPEYFRIHRIGTAIENRHRTHQSRLLKILHAQDKASARH